MSQPAINPDILALRQAIKRLVKAEVAHSWIGNQHPDDFLAIEQELNNARTNYQSKMSILIQKYGHPNDHPGA